MATHSKHSLKNAVIAVFTVLAAAALILPFTEPLPVNADTYGSQKTVSIPQVSEENTFEVPAGSDRDEIRLIFLEAKDRNDTIKIVFPSGTFYIDEPVSVYSGTVVEMAADTVIKNSDPRSVIFSNSNFYSDDVGGYEQSDGIYFKGGILDGGDSAASGHTGLLEIRHARNTVISGVTFRNFTEHALNLSGTENSLVENCTFEKAVKYTGSDADFWKGFTVGDNTRYEAIESIHLDSMTEEGEGGANLDNTPCKNITVKGCTFSNVFCCVGNHHSYTGSTRSSNITITDNTFYNIQGCCINVYGFDSTEISGNKASKTGMLVLYVDAGSSLCKNNTFDECYNISGASLKFGIQVSNSSTVTIASNTVKSPVESGIAFFNSTGTISSNNISVRSDNNDASAIRIDEAGNAVISDNMITSAGYAGVYVLNSSKATVNHNTISGTVTGIAVKSAASGGVSLSNNTISYVSGVGVSVDGTDQVTISQCDITDTKGQGIYAKDSSALTISSSTIIYPLQSGIHFITGKGTVSGNTIVLSSDGNVDASAIELDSASDVTVSGNNIKYAGYAGVYVRGSSKARVEDNTITGIRTGIAVRSAASGGVSISRNTVTGARNQGIYIDSTNQATISGCWIINTANQAIYATGLSGLTVKDTLVDSSANAACVQFANAGAVLEQVLVEGSKNGTGVEAIGTSDITIKNCYSANNVKDGFCTQQTASMTISGSYAVNNTRRGVAQYDSSSVTLTNSVTSDNKTENVNILKSSSGNSTASIGSGAKILSLGGALYYINNYRFSYDDNGSKTVDGTAYTVTNARAVKASSGSSDDFSKYADGSLVYGKYNGTSAWWYIKGGKVDTSANTVAANSSGWWKVTNGKVDFDFKGLASNANGWWYLEGGKVNFNYTGYADNSSGRWRIEGGKVNFNYKDVVSESGQWRYYYNGMFQKNYTGVTNCGNSFGWWYVKNGVVDFSANTVASNSNGWWKVTGGKVDFGYKGYADNEIGRWRIESGSVNFNYKDIVYESGQWRYYYNGMFQKSYTGVTNCGNASGWWYVKNGVVDFSANTVASNSNGWWKVTNGKVDFGFTGIASNDIGTWYLKGGKVDFSYNNSSYTYNGKTYNIKGGKAV